MRRVVVFLSAGRLTGVTGDAVVGVEEAVLFVAVGIGPDLGIAIDAQALAIQRIILVDDLDGFAVTVLDLTGRALTLTQIHPLILTKIDPLTYSH